MDRHTAKVTNITRETHDTVTIHFTVPHFVYSAGQYITVFFDDSSVPEGKAYSLSSAPHETEPSITVKEVGEYSRRLHALRVGDTFQISDAYGFFNPETTKPLVCISAGCGLAPIWSIVKHECAHDARRLVYIFYSNKTTDDIVFREGLSTHDGAELHVSHHITRADKVQAPMHKGRINLDTCVDVIEGEVMYLLCGSVEFVRDMWRGLVDRGVPTHMISTETFFE